MAKKKVIKQQAGQSEKVIQYIAIGIIAIVLAVFAWRYVPKQSSTSVAVGDSGVACEPFGDIEAQTQYNAAPEMGIDIAKTYTANFKMEKGGEFSIKLFADKSPITVNNFVFLSCKGFYNGTTFHRVIEGFMAQGGDPTGTGTGGPGYQFEDETSNGLTFDKPGILAMANSGPNTNGSQFFITFVPTPHLDGRHTIFGEVTTGIEVVNAITLRDPSFAATEGDKIQSVTISVE